MVSAMIATTVNDNSMKNSFAVSTALHIFLLVLLYIGLPVLFMPPPEHHDPVPFEIVDISEITNTRIKPAEEKVQPPSPPPKPAPKSPAAPTTKTPEAVPEVLNVPKPAEKPKQPDKPKPDALANILKNVEKMKTTESKTETKDTSQKQEEVKTASPMVSDKLTISQQDALIRQLKQCWYVPNGARDLQNLVVEVVIAVNPDRTVARADVVDKNRMATDPFFRAAAESALRALYNPQCTPLELPADQYDKWKVIDFTFDPRDML